MFSGSEIVSTLTELGVTHVVWVPDSVLGTWETALEQAPELSLVRVCREGEAWTIAAGLHLGGKKPLVMLQCTGLFESGDALRNVLFDLGLPLYALVGYRSYLVENSPDSARRFAQPIVQAWGLDCELILPADGASRLADHYRKCQAQRRPGLALIAEGAG